ncbi:ATP-binding cassette domain-containing protein, partial [Amylibacter sp.]|nr:ATP-binding cassette domain-containing protein [Amylibacter sp.]
MSEPIIEMIGVNKWYGDFQALKNINFTVHEGDRIVVCGPSGSGKSTMIRTLNYLEAHQEGTIRVDGKEMHA